MEEREAAAAEDDMGARFSAVVDTGCALSSISEALRDSEIPVP